MAALADELIVGNHVFLLAGHGGWRVVNSAWFSNMTFQTMRHRVNNGAVRFAEPVEGSRTTVPERCLTKPGADAMRDALIRFQRAVVNLKIDDVGSGGFTDAILKQTPLLFLKVDELQGMVR